MSPRRAAPTNRALAIRSCLLIASVALFILGASSKPDSAALPSTEPSPTTKELVLEGTIPVPGILQIAFLKRTSDGHLWPYAIPGMELVRSDDSWSCAYSMDTSDLKIPVGPAQKLRQLVIGAKYKIRSSYPISGTFAVPDIKPGETHRVEIICTDGAVPGGDAPPQDGRNIRGVVNLNKATAQLIGADKMIATYAIGDEPVSVIVGKDGDFKLSNTVLGGELMISIARIHHPIYYVARVDKEDIQLPADADLNLIDHHVADVDLRTPPNLDTAKVIGIFALATERSRLPVAWMYLKHGEKAPDTCRLSLPPGRFWIQVVPIFGVKPVIGSITVPEGGGKVGMGAS
jgi:hypothetical protein